MIQLKWVMTALDEYYIYSPERERYWYIGHNPIPTNAVPGFVPPHDGSHLSKRSYYLMIIDNSWATYDDALVLQEGL